MVILVIGLVVFFSAHLYSAFRSREPEADIKRRLGTGKYMGLYSLVSLLGFGLILWGYGQAEPSQYLYAGFNGARDISALLMMPSLLLLVASQLPTGHIKRITVHPMLIGVGIWAIAHLIDGANLKQILLFGAFLLYSIIDIPAVNRRAESNAASKTNARLSYDVMAVALAAAFYIGLVYGLHKWLFGLSPLV